jgi:hypothetical protein
VLECAPDLEEAREQMRRVGPRDREEVLAVGVELLPERDAAAAVGRPGAQDHVQEVRLVARVQQVENDVLVEETVGLRG